MVSAQHRKRPTKNAALNPTLPWPHSCCSCCLTLLLTCRRLHVSCMLLKLPAAVLHTLKAQHNNAVQHACCNTTADSGLQLQELHRCGAAACCRSLNRC